MSTAFEDAREKSSKNSRRSGVKRIRMPALVYQSCAGNAQVIVSPPPGVVVASTVPSAATTMCLTIASPSPVPRVERARSAR